MVDGPRNESRDAMAYESKEDSAEQTKAEAFQKPEKGRTRH